MSKLNSQLNKQSIPLVSETRFATWSQKIQKPKNVTEETSIFFNTCFDKGHVKELVSWFLNQYGEKPTINFLESLKFIGFHQATKAGISLGIEDLEIPPEKSILITEAHIATHKIEQQSAAGSLTSVEKSQCLIDTWNQTSDLLRQNAIQNFRNRNVVNPVYMMAFSGARGNVSQVRQLVAMRGLMANPQGAILEFPIQSNFREGLTITEYLISCYGARKGLVDTALRTATSGYLTRRLVDSAQHAVIAMIDCGSNRTNKLQGKNLENRLIGRVLGESLVTNGHKTFYRNHVISPTDANLISKHYNQVFVRSPLTCTATTSVCQFCYGWNLASGKLVQIGEAVGVIAAQSIGEPGTQLTMRTFHTGGVGVFSDQALKPIFATYKGKIIFENSIPGHFIRTPHGKIVYMIKYIPSNPERIFFRIQPLNAIHRDLIIRESDLPPGSLLFVKHGEIVETKKLVAQASHVKLTKQRLPESSYPVYSPLEGQIFFESMNLLIEKEISIDMDGAKKKLDFENKFLSSKNSGLPDLRRMAKIGSFWIFSAYNQHEIHTLNHFVEPGDLVSSSTILFNYKFHSSTRFQLQKINSKLMFGMNSIQIPIKRINFFNTSYKIYSENCANEKFIYHKTNNNKALLFWYPSNNLTYSKFNFKHFVPLYNEVQPKTNIDLITFRLIPPKGLIFNVCFLDKKLNHSEFDSKKVKNFRKNFYSIFSRNRDINYNSNQFLIKSLENLFIRTNLPPHNLTPLVALNVRKMGWAYIFKNKNLVQFTPISQRQFFPTGLSFNKICFPKRNVSIKNLNNINVGLFKNDLDFENSNMRYWYQVADFRKQDENFLNNSKLSIKFPKYNSTTSLKLGLVWYFLKISIKQKNIFPQNLKLYKSNRKYFSFANLVLIQPVTEYSFPTKRTLQNQLANFCGKISIENPQNFLFSKQHSTLLQLTPKIKNQLQVYTTAQSGWFALQNLFRIQFLIKNTSLLQNRYFGYQTLSHNLSRGLNIYQYHPTVFNEVQKFSFKTYWNHWVLPFQSFSSGTVKIKTTGEFRFKVQKTTGTFISVLRNTDVLTLKNSSPEFIKIGKIIRWGEQLEPGHASDHNGQILKKNNKSITIRLGIPILASAHGIVHVFQDDLVIKNQLLITLKSRRLQTEDIVQGIPKIEQLFEARESQGGEVLFDTVHIRLRNSFLRELGSLEEDHWSIAVEKSFLEAQQFLVGNIVEAYANQGVKISEKHVEVIVRQMTSRVRILESGETGLLPGELVQHTWIQKFNKNIREIGLREATYEPIVLGISKSVLQSESFLLAASFQEVSRVLVRSALSKKRDFLRGLHENVIVGQLIPAGTGLLSQFNNSEFLPNPSN
jgi:hypothetical protein